MSRFHAVMEVPWSDGIKHKMVWGLRPKTVRGGPGSSTVIRFYSNMFVKCCKLMWNCSELIWGSGSQHILSHFWLSISWEKKQKGNVLLRAGACHRCIRFAAELSGTFRNSENCCKMAALAKSSTSISVHYGRVIQHSSMTLIISNWI